QNTLNPDFNRDFIDGYIKKIKESDSESASHFNENNLLGSTAEFLLTGTGPPSSQIFWFLPICAQNPNSVQNKIQKEIDDIVGPHRQPTWKDRKSMPFTMASLKEGLRWKTIGIISGSRGILKDTFIGEYFIPKGTIVFLNLRAVHKNPAYWNNPDEFDPTRFMTSDGKLLEKNEDCFVPFGVGKRNCPGQVLGNAQLFLYTTTLLQKLNVFPEYQDQLDIIGSVDLAEIDPRVQRLRFVPR
ncbi:cytochrome P450, putative, partial [Ixodes scapularis]